MSCPAGEDDPPINKNDCCEVSNYKLQEKILNVIMMSAVYRSTWIKDSDANAYSVSSLDHHSAKLSTSYNIIYVSNRQYMLEIVE